MNIDISLASARPHVLVVGGEDVEKRLELVRAISEDFSVTVAGPNPEYGELFEGEGIEYHTYPLTRGVAPLKDLRTLVVLTLLVRRIQPDIVHAFATKPSVWARIAARIGSDAVVIGTLPGRGSLFWASGPWIRFVRGIYRRIQTIASRAADLTIFYNESDARTFIESGIVSEEAAAIVQGSGIPTDDFTPEQVPEDVRSAIRGEFDVPSGGILVTMVARAIRTKGVMEYAAAAAELAAEGLDVRFLLVGADDPGSVDRLDRAERARVRETVVWAGHRSDVREVLAASDVFVLPSYGEGIPRALMEAGAMGLPAVTTRVPGCQDVVEDGRNGILIPPRDPEALTTALRSLITDALERQRLGAEARRIAVEKFDTKAVAREVTGHYRRLLAERSGRRRQTATSEPADDARDRSLPRVRSVR